ncbi:hypothetical protein FA13DRAFT_1815419 [Coprinellus micaceus]|uniref:C2H2-type domain-containing protein n=1 Tax=Coprinellus micaceus TaxID=71717 RepID=A0A4Y7T5R5_COPMI|nr:hypothetical protein FA13DRAFT_1815419 [Coprinellus micaceus]
MSFHPTRDGVKWGEKCVQSGPPPFSASHKARVMGFANLIPFRFFPPSRRPSLLGPPLVGNIRSIRNYDREFRVLLLRLRQWPQASPPTTTMEGQTGYDRLAKPGPVTVTAAHPTEQHVQANAVATGDQTENCDPDNKQCTACNIYFSTVARLKLHKMTTHGAEEMRRKLKEYNDQVGMKGGEISKESDIPVKLTKSQKARRRMQLRRQGGLGEQELKAGEAEVPQRSEPAEQAVQEKPLEEPARKAPKKRKQRKTRIPSQPAPPEVKGVTLNARDLKCNAVSTSLPNPLPAEYFEQKRELDRVRAAQTKEKRHKRMKVRERRQVYKAKSTPPEVK